ncbi:MAG: hypothetical protein ACD_75C01492G0001, partial [uncultured bacterium]
MAVEQRCGGNDSHHVFGSVDLNIRV